VSNTDSWNKAVERFMAERPSADAVSYGTDMPRESELRLLGTSDLKGKRILELGSRGGGNAMALARAGAHVIVVDPAKELLVASRQAADEVELKVEWHVSELAELAFLRADSVDIALCMMALSEHEDIGRVLRQVHRVLKNGSPFLFSLEHPMAMALMEGPGRRAYHDPNPITVTRYGQPFTLFPRTTAEVFTAVTRAGYRVDALVEPPASTSSGSTWTAPAGIIFRARKVGV
jgi:2-polyprenyl-3-methyl-5-hydroxy-6-metoxy-1,4-benzoquinol methylase